MEKTAQHITAIIKQLFDVDMDVRLDRPDPQFGDYATNASMQLAGRLGRNPREIAEQIAGVLRESGHYSAVDIAGPGFINLRIADVAVLAEIDADMQKVHEGARYVLEYSCPNAFKELHTGHLYQTIYGDALARLLESTGATVHRTSFGGDVGLHVAKCLWGIVHELGGESPELLDTVSTDPLERAAFLSKCYVVGARQYEDDEATKADIDELNKTIYGFHNDSDHESPLAQTYWATRQWSFDYFDAFYNVIKVDSMKYYPESVTAVKGLEIVREQLAKGNLVESDGAVVFVGDESKHLHTRVFVTSKGLPTYETKDIGVIAMEREEFDFSYRILITGNDQKEYMRVVFAAADVFSPGLGDIMTHLTNGTVKFADGKKMSSRLGNVTRAIDVVDEVKRRVADLVEDKTLIDDVALGAIKYGFLQYRFGGDIAFNIDELVSLQGKSGPYLQYAHARACSIVRKATTSSSIDHDLDEYERALAVKLSEYNDVAEKAASEYMLHGIAHYLYDLSQVFNRFYENSKIVGDPRETTRLALTEHYRDTLAAGLEILGILAPEKM